MVWLELVFKGCHSERGQRFSLADEESLFDHISKETETPG
jgi:hypothetical protein